ncbi:MAG: DUF177 domain-containing protein, partial [Bacteroidota bacterium]|nr:DUF177 domain-containing protein [Bacteroidota bacterium]
MSNPLRAYIIPINKLKPGRHSYDFAVDKDFFSHFEHSIAKDGDIEVKVQLDKQSETLLVLNFHISGTLSLNCDRCLDAFNYPLDITERIIVKLEHADAESESASEELIFLDPEVH